MPVLRPAELTLAFYPTMAALGMAHAGILYCHQQKYSIGQLMMMCLLAADCYTQEAMLEELNTCRRTIRQAVVVRARAAESVTD
jgi:hypothetical protein